MEIQLVLLTGNNYGSKADWDIVSKLTGTQHIEFNKISASTVSTFSLIGLKIKLWLWNVVAINWNVSLGVENIQGE